MDRSDIAEAITIFKYSQTAQLSARSASVVRQLNDLYRRDEIGGFGGRRPRYGRWQAGRADYDLGINTRSYERILHVDRLAYLSLELVHEGSHAADKLDDIYSELAARMLAILYYRELSGPGVFNEYSDPPVPGNRSRIIRVPSRGQFERYFNQSEALRRDRLIDFILNIGSYAEDVKFDWIAANQRNWGGLQNRKSKTLGLYLRVLASEPAEDRQRATLILDILESVSRQEDWTEMLDEADSLEKIRRALGRVATQRPYADRTAQLQRRWKVRL